MKPIFLCALALSPLAVAAPAAQAQTVDFDATPEVTTEIATEAATPSESGMETMSSSFDNGTSGVQLNRARGRDSSLARFASGTGNLLFLGVGTLLPLVTDGKDGEQHTIRTADALISSTLVAEGLKIAVHKKRPDGTDYKSFPSGHATAAFTVAAMQANSHPRQAIFWYAGATAIAASRVTLRRHDAIDVIAGAALGYGMARLELGQNRGLLLRPFVRQNAPGDRVTGLSLSQTF